MGSLTPRAALASPPTEDPFPELKEGKKPKRAPTPLEAAAARAAGILRSGRGVAPNEDAVEFALWLYGEEGQRADLDHAVKLAREMAGQGARSGAAGCLFRVAQAGGPTLSEAKSIFAKRRGMEAGTLDCRQHALLVLDHFARAGASADPAAIEEALHAARIFRETRIRKEGSGLRVLASEGTSESLAGHAAALRVGLEAAALSGSPVVRDECRLLAREIVDRFWEEKAGRFRDGEAGTAAGDAGAAKAPDAAGIPEAAGGARVATDTAGSSALRENARAALAVWETGIVCGDADLRDRGRRALEGALEESLVDPEAVAAVGLAAGRMAGHPVEMALVGDPGDFTLGALRQAAYRIFEPRRVLLNLDPAADAARFAELLYPPELAPALFVCVGTLCSPPITTAEGLAAHVREFRELAEGAGD